MQHDPWTALPTNAASSSAVACQGGPTHRGVGPCSTVTSSAFPQRPALVGTMTSPADMPRLQFGVMTRWGLAHLLDAGDDGPYWGTRQQAMWTLHSLRALYPDTTYTITTRRTP